MLTRFTTNTTDRLRAAVTRILHRDPFFASGTLACPFVPAPGLGTMATDGIRIMFDPETVADWTDARLDYVNAHEGAHVLLRHPLRAELILSRIPEPWKARAHALLNVAADYIVNAQLDSAGYVGAPDGVRDPRGATHSLEALFAELWAEDAPARQQAEQQQQGGQQQGGQQQGGQQGQQQGHGQALPGPCTGHDPTKESPDPNGAGGILVPSDEALEDQYGQGSREANRTAMARDLSQQAVNADRIARRIEPAGKGAGSRRAFIDAETRGKTDWRTATRQYMTQRARREGYTFRRPSRRSGGGVYLPSRDRTAGARYAAVITDTSGSINRNAFAAFSDEVCDLLRELDIERVDVLAVDTKVQAVQTFEHGDAPERLLLDGGGGTRLWAGLEYVAEHAPEPPAFVIVFTDGQGWDLSPATPPDGIDPSRIPSFPVLWVLWGAYGEGAATGRVRMPFGDTVGMG